MSWLFFVALCSWTQTPLVVAALCRTERAGGQVVRVYLTASPGVVTEGCILYMQLYPEKNRKTIIHRTEKRRHLLANQQAKQEKLLLMIQGYFREIT